MDLEVNFVILDLLLKLIETIDMAQTKINDQIGGQVLELKGQYIGGEETDELRTILRKAIEEGQTNLILDMAKVTYLNSTALGILISTHASVTKKGGKIVICNLAKSLKNIFVITKLTLVFEITETREEAIKIFSQNNN